MEEEKEVKKTTENEVCDEEATIEQTQKPEETFQER